jgi:hypothetical protein
MAIITLSNDFTESYQAFEKNVLAFILSPFNEQLKMYLDKQKDTNPDGSEQQNILKAVEAWLNFLRLSAALNKTVLDDIVDKAVKAPATDEGLQDAFILVHAAIREANATQRVNRAKGLSEVEANAIARANSKPIEVRATNILKAPDFLLGGNMFFMAMPVSLTQINY